MKIIPSFIANVTKTMYNDTRSNRYCFNLQQKQMYDILKIALYSEERGSKLKSEIGSKLKELRKTKRLSQDDVANGTGICRSSLSNYETGRRTPALNQLVILANYYGVTLDYFGIVQEDEVFDLLVRAKKLFENETISNEDKQSLFDELMKFYINIKR